MLEPTNAQRAERAFRTLLVYQQYSGSDRNSALTDLLTDLMHLQAEESYIEFFDECLETARMHYEAEADTHDEES